MIGVSIEKCYTEDLGGNDNLGPMLLIQIGPLLFTFYIGWGR